MTVSSDLKTAKTFLVQYRFIKSVSARTSHTLQTIVHAANDEIDTLNYELRSNNAEWDTFEIIGSRKISDKNWVHDDSLTDAQLYDVVCDYYDRNHERLGMVKNKCIIDFIAFDLKIYNNDGENYDRRLLPSRIQAIMKLLEREEIENEDAYKDLRRKKQIEVGTSIHKVRTITPETFKLDV